MSEIKPLRRRVLFILAPAENQTIPYLLLSSTKETSTLFFLKETRITDIKNRYKEPYSVLSADNPIALILF